MTQDHGPTSAQGVDEKAAAGYPLAEDSATAQGSESENPAIDSPTPKTGGRPRTIRDWWPNQLDLSVLHAHSSKGNPLGLSYPTEGAILMISPSGIPKGAKNMNGAKLFMEFLMSEENSRIMADEFQESMRPEVPPATGAKSLAEVKTIRPTTEEIEAGIPRVKEKWRDTFGI